MGGISLSDSELRVMNVIWGMGGETTASRVAAILKERGLSAAATYTLLGRCVKKGALERTEPNYVCHALVTREEVQDTQIDDLVDNVFEGSVDKLLASLIDRNCISPEEIRRLCDECDDGNDGEKPSAT